MLPIEYVFLLEQKGRSLDSAGVNGKGLDRLSALNAVKILQEAKIPIIGVDVFVTRNDALSLTYDSWYCTSGDTLTYMQQFDQFYKAIISFIQNYDETTDREIYFQIITIDGTDS